MDENLIESPKPINEKILEREIDNISCKKNENNGFDFSFKNNFKNSKNCSSTKVHSIIIDKTNNQSTIPNLEKTILNSNRRYKEDQINNSPKFSDTKKYCSSQCIGNPNSLPYLNEKDFLKKNNDSNKDLNNLDVGQILNSKVYEDNKFCNVENINNLDILKRNTHNQDNLLSIYENENSLRDNIPDKQQIRNSSKSIDTINSLNTDWNETKKNRIKLTLNSQNTLFTNQSGTNNTIVGTNNFTHFTVLEHDEIEIKNFKRNEYGDSFCEAFFHAGLLAKKVKMIPDSDSFIPPCKHKNCAILNAYRPEIIECFPTHVIDGIEINSTVIFYLNLFYFRQQAFVFLTE